MEIGVGVVRVSVVWIVSVIIGGAPNLISFSFFCHFSNGCVTSGSSDSVSARAIVLVSSGIGSEENKIRLTDAALFVVDLVIGGDRCI